MSYTHFRYIAYQVPTVAEGADGKNIYAIPTGPPLAVRPVLRGNFAALGEDAERRVERLLAVMALAATWIQASNPSERDEDVILKIFMAPEFYFRPAQADVSYTYAQYRAIKDVLRQTIAGDGRFKHWLVIPGTIMWVWDQDTPKRPNKARINIYFNSAVRITGNGVMGQNKESAVIEKASPSDVDGLPGIATDQVPDWKAWEESSSKYETRAKKDKHIFEVGGTSVGLEICGEHDLAVPLLKPLLTEERNKDKRIKLHLLTACGMPIQPESVAAVKGGFVLRTDGLVDSSSDPRSELMRVEEYTLDEQTVTEKEPDSEAQLKDIPPRHTIRIAGEADPSLPIPPPPNVNVNSWTGFEQLIKIFPCEFVP